MIHNFVYFFLVSTVYKHYQTNKLFCKDPNNTLELVITDRAK